MYNFGEKSKNQLNTLHPDLAFILVEAIKYYDFSVIQGLRSDGEQLQLFTDGKSKLDGITRKSKHQGEVHNDRLVSMAVDIIPYAKGHNAFSGDVEDNARFYFMMGMIKHIAENFYDLGLVSHKVRFGMDWDNDDIFSDQTFHDLPHLELI